MKFVPSHALWDATSWRADIHRFTDPRFRDRVRALLLCWRTPKSGLLHALPHPLVEDIVNHMCDDVHDRHLGEMRRVMTDLSWDPLTLPNASTSACTINARHESQLPTSPLVHGRAIEAPALQTRVNQGWSLSRGRHACRFHMVERRDTATTIEIDVGLDVQRPAHEFEACVWMYDQVLGLKDSGDVLTMYKPGDAHEVLRVRRCEFDAMIQSGMARRENVATFHKVNANFHRRALNRARTRAGRYVLCLGDSISNFDASKRVVLTSRDPQWGMPFSALLLMKPHEFR